MQHLHPTEYPYRHRDAPMANDEHVALLKGRRRSLREIARELMAMGYTNKGALYSASCVKSMVEGPSPVSTEARR
jgi:hypothetical protein